MTTSEIINAINSLDYDYCMIDNQREYSHHANLNWSINNAIKTVTPEQAVEIYNGIKDSKKGLSHAKALLAMFPEPTPTPEPSQAKTASNKVALFNNAWSMFKQGLFVSFAQALKAAWKRLKVVAGMKSGIVQFEYIKTDGSIRLAKGTLTGFDYTTKTTDQKVKPEIVKYFDIEAQSFRSFRIDRFIGLVA
jgi:hypothetical protein